MATLKLTLKSESGEGWGGQTTEYYNGFLTIDDVDYTIYKDYYQGDYTKNYDDEYLIELEPGDIQWSYRVPINQAEDTTSNFQPQKNQWKLEDLNGDILFGLPFGFLPKSFIFFNKDSTNIICICKSCHSCVRPFTFDCFS